jgi:hypothetical protein
MISFYFLADRNDDGTYSRTGLYSDIDYLFGGLEYGDVFEGNYQIWEFPSGKISMLKPDREVPKDDYYAAPYKDYWLPILEYIKTDKQKVTQAVRDFLQSALMNRKYRKLDLDIAFVENADEKQLLDLVKFLNISE